MKWLNLQSRKYLAFATRYRLYILLVSILVPCLFLLGHFALQGVRERHAIDAVERQGGHVGYDYHPASSWRASRHLQRLLRGSYFGEGVTWGVDQVGYYPTTGVTDAGLSHIREFAEMKVLGLSETGITDAGLPHLTQLRELRVLYLQDTSVSDSGLKHLNALAKLEFLDLSRTQITDLGVAQLRPFRALQNLTLDDTNVTDAGLVHLYGLTRLQTLSVVNTGVTSAGVQQLQAALPNCQIYIQRQD